MKQAMVRKAMWDWVYQSYLVTNRRQLSNHQQHYQHRETTTNRINAQTNTIPTNSNQRRPKFIYLPPTYLLINTPSTIHSLPPVLNPPASSAPITSNNSTRQLTISHNSNQQRTDKQRQGPKHLSISDIYTRQPTTNQLPALPSLADTNTHILPSDNQTTSSSPRDNHQRLRQDQ
jgi:hypothetical protein